MVISDPTTVRLSVAAALLKLESQLREIGSGRKAVSDRAAIRSIRAARDSLLQETDG